MRESKRACFLPIPVSLLCLLLHQQAAHYLDLLREPEANLVQQVNRRFAQYPVNQIYGV